MSKIKTKLQGRSVPCEHRKCPEYLKHRKCYNANAHHHLFSNDTRKNGNRDRYGDLIDEDFNIIFINNDCHITKAIPKFTEIEFRSAAESEGYTLPPAGKSLQFKRFN